MKGYELFRGFLVASCLLASNFATAFPQERAAPHAVRVHMVITDESVREDSEVPAQRQDDVKVKQGKTFLQVTQLIAARGDAATLQLFMVR